MQKRWNRIHRQSIIVKLLTETSGVATGCLGRANQEKLLSEAFAYFEQKQVGDQSYDFCDDSGVRHSTGMNYWRGADSRFSIANARGGTESWTRSTRRRVCPCCARRIVQARNCLFASALASALIPQASAFYRVRVASGSLETSPSEPILLYLRLRTWILCRKVVLLNRSSSSLQAAAIDFGADPGEYFFGVKIHEAFLIGSNLMNENVIESRVDVLANAFQVFLGIGSARN
jgi:hypothetical protein